MVAPRSGGDIGGGVGGGDVSGGSEGRGGEGAGGARGIGAEHERHAHKRGDDAREVRTAELEAGVHVLDCTNEELSITTSSNAEALAPERVVLHVSGADGQLVVEEPDPTGASIQSRGAVSEGS